MDEYGREIEDSNAFWDSSQADFQIKVAFLVGQTENNETQAKIVEESQLYNDMIQESFLDTYNNLTLKTIMMLKWVNSNCMDKGKIEIIPGKVYSLNFIYFKLCSKIFNEN